MLRGINVSGQKMIKMEALRKMFEEMKFKNVRTYIQSGNILFEDKGKPHSTLEKQIHKKIMDTFGFDVKVLVIDKDEIEKAIDGNDFVNKRKEDITKMHITFLSEEPIKANIDKLKDWTHLDDEFIIKGRIVYLFCPKGYGVSKLSNNFFESKLKVDATTRNWRTVNELLNMAG